MTIIGYQFDKSKVTPESDASLYSYLAQGLDNKVIKGMTATGSGLNLYIEPGKALVQGRFVEVTQQHQLSARANTSGYVVITIDLTQTNTAIGTPGTVDYNPVNNQLRLEIVESLNQQDLGSGGVIYTLPLFSYTTTGSSVVLTKDSKSFKLSYPTKTWSGELGGGITLSLRKKGTTVEYSIGGEISSNILANSNLVKLSVPNEFCPIKRYSLVGHMAAGWNSFHIDVTQSGVCQWFGPTTNTGAPRGTGTYPLD